MNPFGLGIAQQPPSATVADRGRISRYASNLRLYKGWLDQMPAGIVPGDPTVKRLVHNLFRPISDIAGDWVVGPEIGWQVIGSSGAETEILTQAAVDIWDRSGGSSEFAQAAHTAMIYGDLAAVVQGTGEDARIVFPDPCVCYPTFNDHDCSKLDGLSIEYKLASGDWHKDEYQAGQAVWIPNRAIKGEPTGEGEFESVIDLVVEYDHIRRKKTRIIDYYAKPTPVLEGVSGGADFGSLNTVLKMPAGSKAYFLEWSGTPPDVEEHLEQVRWSICAVSQTPPIAFAEIDKTFSGSSGVALKVMFGPLESKTARRRMLWGPKLAEIMASALKAAGYDVDPRQVAPLWQSSMPSADSEELSNVEALGRIGLSRIGRLRRLGYDEREIAENEAQLFDETQARAAAAVKMFTRGAEVE